MGRVRVIGYLYKEEGKILNLSRYKAVATWHWEVSNESVCGICQHPYEGACPICRFPGDDCPLSMFPYRVRTICNYSVGCLSSCFSYALYSQVVRATG